MEKRDIEAAIGEVARKHNLLLSADDPILITITLNEMILSRLLGKLQLSIEAAQDQISAGSAQHIEKAKEVAGIIITSAADYVATQTRLAIDALRDDLLAAAAAERQRSAVIAASAIQAQHNARIAAAIAIGITCLLIGVAVALSLDIPGTATPPRPSTNTLQRADRM